MAITYHAGRRLQGLSYTASTLTTSGFAGTWDKSPSDSQFEVSGGKLNFLENASSGGDRTWIDLGTDVSETKWILRVRLRFTTIANQSNYPEIDIGISDNHANSDTDQDFIGCRILPMSTNNIFRPRKCIDGSGTDAGKPRRGSAADHFPSPAFTTGKDYYIEIVRTSATDWSASMSNTNAYDGDIYSDSFTTATTSLDGLRYFTVMDGTTATSGDMEGYIDVFEFYNDTNTVATASGDAKPTNVQVGSRYEETDTRKMYHYELTGDVTTDGLYTVLKYRSDGTFTPTSPFNVEYLVVAGGGGGGSSYGGGGGAGGLKTNFGGTALGVTAQNYDITVGAGGASGQVGAVGTGTVGGNSTFSSITSTGGGGGRTYWSAASNGGSGGGGSLTNSGGNTAGTGISGQGHDGAAGSGYGGYAGNGGGGGGGAGSAGSGINGGTGLSSSITGTSLFYAGGGGAARVNLAGGAGGSGVGGTGGYNTNPTGGVVNTGSGGGGGNAVNDGGSDGVVILRFLTSGNTYTTSLSTNVWSEEGT